MEDQSKRSDARGENCENISSSFSLISPAFSPSTGFRWFRISKLVIAMHTYIYMCILKCDYKHAFNWSAHFAIIFDPLTEVGKIVVPDCARLLTKSVNVDELDHIVENLVWVSHSSCQTSKAEICLVRTKSALKIDSPNECKGSITWLASLQSNQIRLSVYFKTA